MNSNKAKATTTPKYETVAISQLKLDPNNARKHPPTNINRIKASLAAFGQQKPIIIDRENVVRAGNGTLLAAMELGWKEMQVVRSDLSGDAATAYAIADNRTAELAEWDDMLLAQQLAELAASSEQLWDAAGFTAETPHSGKQVSGDEREPSGDFEQVDESLETKYECPKCHFKWS